MQEKIPCWQPHPIDNLVEPESPSIWRYLAFFLLVLAMGYAGKYYYPNGWTGEQPNFWDIFMLIPLSCAVVLFVVRDICYFMARTRNELLIKQNKHDFQAWRDWAQHGWVIRHASVILPESIELEARVNGFEDIESRYGQVLLFGDASSRQASPHFVALFKHFAEILHSELHRKNYAVNSSSLNPTSSMPIAITIILPPEYCSGQPKLATVLEFSQYNRSDSLGVNPPLY